MPRLLSSIQKFDNPQHAYTKKLMAAVPVPDPARYKTQRFQ